MVTEVIQGGVLNGDFNNMTSFDNALPTDPIVQYFTNKFNAKPCAAGTAASGIPDYCKHQTTSGLSGSTNLTSGRWILPTGASIQFFFPSWVNRNSIAFLIESVNNTYPVHCYIPGSSQVLILCNLTDAPVVYDSPTNTVPTNPGGCTPYISSKLVFDNIYGQ